MTNAKICLNGSKTTVIVEEIAYTITTYLNQVKDVEQVPWINIWKKWQANDFMNATRRSQLSRVINDLNEVTQEQTLIIPILRSMFEQIPQLEEWYSIQTDDNDLHYLIRNVSNKTTKTNKNNQKDSNNEKDVKKLTKEKEINYSKEMNATIKESNKKHDLASDWQSPKARNSFKNNKTTNNAPKKPENIPTENKFQKLIDEIVNEDAIIDSSDGGATISDMDTTNNDYNSDVSLNSNNIYKEVGKQMANKNINKEKYKKEEKKHHQDATKLQRLMQVMQFKNVDIDDLVNWIENDGCKAIDIVTENATKRIQETTTSNQLQLEEYYDKKMNEMKNTQITLNAKFNEFKKNQHKLKQDIIKETTNATIAIGLKTTAGTTEIMKEMNKAETMMNKLEDFVKFSNTYLEQSNRLKQHAEKVLKDGYLNFQDSITEIADVEMGEITTYISKYSDKLKNLDIAMIELEHERDMQQAERKWIEEDKKMIKREKALLDERKAILDEWHKRQEEIDKRNKSIDTWFSAKLKQAELCGHVITTAKIVPQLHEDQKINSKVQQSYDNNNQEEEDEETRGGQQQQQHYNNSNETPVPKDTKFAAPPSSNSICSSNSNYPPTPSLHNPSRAPTQPLFKESQRVLYKPSISNGIKGIVLSAGYDDTIRFKGWKYCIFTEGNQLLENCDERMMYEIKDATNIKQHQQQNEPMYGYKQQTIKDQNQYNEDNQFDHYNTPDHHEYDTAYLQYHNDPRGRPPPYLSSPRHRTLTDNQYIYPIGSNPKTVTMSTVWKYGEHWTISLKHADEIQTFYDDLKSHMMDIHVILKNYEDIESDGNILAINSTNCINYDKIKPVMSSVIFKFLTIHKEKIFGTYRPPIDYIEACESTNDGLTLVRKIISKVHPKLMKITKHQLILPKPTFIKCKSIHVFIKRYQQWLINEKIKGRETYSDEENINYLLAQLDDRFITATNKIRNQLEEYDEEADPPKPFPHKLKFGPELGTYIIELINPEDRNNLTNEITEEEHEDYERGGSINKVGDRQSEIYRQSNKHAGGMNRRGYYQRGSSRYPKSRYQQQQSSKPKYQFKLKQGAICKDCGNTNHEVYETGDTKLPEFSLCQHFYKNIPEHILNPALKQFKSYAKQKKIDRNKDRQRYGKAVKTLEEKNCDKATINEIQAAFKEDYYDNYPEETMRDEPPDLFTPSSDSNDSSDDDSSIL